ncbi:hypothetical protein HYALB_00004918 [Hymenoscyphus albidus]|uniref:Acyl-CoA thioesterase II n=1 Tax=Hymenoscyphus albidus TaxID=595503 RepID=A0A9N9LGS8_9HELO|nr:hypothetical protein HYALB_00004918 [Hymenoscyphus albidus]
MADRRTLVRPPPLDPSKSAIENVLELTELKQIGPDMFTNTRPLWHPPGARGIYGGAVIAQCLAAGQRTVPENFTVHSMHCYFVLAGDATIPVMYYVEHVREGRSFATRTVQARQRGMAIFTTTMSFTREDSGGHKTVEHAVPLPGKHLPPPDVEDEDLDGNSPFMCRRIDMLNKDSKDVYTKRPRQWIKARGRISEAGGHQAHLSALAYMSDSYFIGTVSRINNLWRFGESPEGTDLTPAMEQRKRYLQKWKVSEGLHPDAQKADGQPEVGMMVSLDHSIYFHEPRNFRADEWMYSEMTSPWSGKGRGVVQQHMFSADGTLIATCFQEGVVRLKEDKKATPPASKL